MNRDYRSTVKKKYLITLASVILLLIFFSFVKVNTTIYVGYYLDDMLYNYDIVLKIDDREILNDTLTSFPFCAQFCIDEKLKCGFHKVSVYSNSANVYQEEKVFILPNQHISIEFLPADTLTFRHYSFPDSLFINGIELTDSIIKLYKKSSRYYEEFLPDTIDLPNSSGNSRFDIEVDFNPFRAM